MTDFISRLKELRGRATQGEWVADKTHAGLTMADNELIAEMRNSLDLWLELADAVEELTPGWDMIEKALAKLKGESGD